MDKTININIAGTLFQIDDEAYRILRDYLQAINNRFRNVQGGHETIEDIESRIAEIFQSQKSSAGVISKDNVEKMISIIGKPEDFDLNESEPDAPVYTSQRKRMYRNPEDTIISGVCGGIGAYLNTDPVLIRILFVLFAVFFGVGFFVYIALWIALPPANNDTQKREMYGNAYHSANSYNKQPGETSPDGSTMYNRGYYNTSRLDNAFNEIFRAVGRVFYIALRIILIIIGISLVITGFLCILSFVMIFVFKMPGAITAEGLNMSLTYFPDFLNYVVNPSLTPWIIGLVFVVLFLPMIAMIYWGVKMIFWFKANDGIFSLAGLVLWVISLAALAILLFNDGISFAETAKTATQSILTPSPDTLYVKTSNKISDLRYDKEFSIMHDDYSVLINDEKKELYIRPYLNVRQSDDDVTMVKVRKRSSGRSKIDAMKRTDGLLYNYRFSGDTLFVDEYFTITSGRKWSADNVGINLYIPKGTILKLDNASENLFHSHNNFSDDDFSESAGWDTGRRSWILTDEGLRVVRRHPSGQK
jgi:phage shock protein PspC (stress-responsive transcriptional regulator)